MPTVWPLISTISNGSQRPACWLRFMRRKSLAKYRIAPRANSASDWLKTPRPLVKGTGLSTSSGKSTPSRPAERECTQRALGHMANTSRSNWPATDQLKITVASAASRSNASTELPTAMLVSAGSCAKSFKSGSARPADSTKTVRMSIRRKLPHLGPLAAASRNHLPLVGRKRSCRGVVGEGVEDVGCVQDHDAFPGRLNVMGDRGVQGHKVAGDRFRHVADHIRERSLAIQFHQLSRRFQGVIQIHGNALRHHKDRAPFGQ